MRFIAVLATFLITLPANAESSQWLDSEGIKLRLIAMRSADGETVKAGLQMKLEPGWKTYWRSPGSSGLPPQVDLSQSTNVASTAFAYPAPIAFGDADGLTAGYTDSVTFPITIKPLFTERKVKLVANGVIGVCAEICVPMQFKLTLDETGSQGTSFDVVRALNDAQAALPGPQTQAFGIEEAASRIGEGVSGAGGGASGAEKSVEVIARVPKGTKQATLFLEGPQSLYLAPTEATKIEGGRARFTVRASEPVAPGTKLTATLVAGEKSIEQSVIVSR